MSVRLIVCSVVLLATGCSAGDDPGAGPAATRASPDSIAGSSPAGPVGSAAPQGTLIEATYAGGQVSGVEPRVAVALGELVVLRVTSDVPEQIHVHGYDVVASVAAGGTAEVQFVVDKPGTWQVELHEAGRPLLQLTVS